MSKPFPYIHFFPLSFKVNVIKTGALLNLRELSIASSRRQNNKKLLGRVLRGYAITLLHLTRPLGSRARHVRISLIKGSRLASDTGRAERTKAVILSLCFHFCFCVTGYVRYSTLHFLAHATHADAFLWSELNLLWSSLKSSNSDCKESASQIRAV